SPHLTAGELAGSLYVGFGEADRMMSVASMRPFIKAVSALGDRAVVDILPGADHAYTWPDAHTYNEAAATRAWTQTLTLFGNVLDPERG
ncbi:MAG: dienelactone hydrolase family protein, partial [Acidimicrobiaceae bacterium]|nr:dienelactone hydrolase family protein [Acidimicrobiaceae bacterium]